MKLAWLTFVFMTVCWSPGVLSQFSQPSGDICPGSDIEFSCVGNSLLNSNTGWEITPDGGEPACIVVHNRPEQMQSCGTERIFTSSLTGQTGLNYTSSLRAEDVPLSLNWTVVECVDGADLQLIGSANICVIYEVLYPPEFQSATVMRGEGEDEWVVRVEWSEATVSCSGSVSQYVLCVTPLTPGGQSGECMTTDQTQYDLTVTSNMRYNLTIRADACDNSIMGNESDLETLRLNDGTRTNSYNATYSDPSGILESISLSYGEFSLEFLGRTSSHMYTLSLSPRYLYEPDGAGSLEVVTGALSSTISVPDTAIAEYSPTVTVNITGATPVNFTSQPILSEDDDLGGEFTAVDINGSCYSLVSCLAMDSLQTCTVYCGASADFASLINNGSVTSTDGDDITVQLPPATGQEYHCIVSGSTGDGSTLFRFRAMEETFGCTVVSLLETERVPECSYRGDGSCTCTLKSNDGRSGMMYDGTSVGSTAVVFTDNSNCYNRDQLLERECGDNEQWSGDTLNQNDIHKALKRQKLSGWNIALIIVGVILFVVGVCVAIALAVLLTRRIIAGWKVKVWYWVLVGVSAFITLVVLILWIVLAAFVSNNEFVKGGFCEDSGKWRQDNSLCKMTAPNSVKNGLVVACFVLSFVVIIGWVACLFLMKWGLRPPPPNKPFVHNVTELGAVPPVDEKEDETDMYDVPDKKPTSPQPLLDKKEHSKVHKGKPDGVHYGQLDHAYKKKKATVTPAPTSPPPTSPPPAAQLASATAEGEYGKLDRSQIQEDPDHYGKLDHPGKKKTHTLPAAAAASADESQYGKLDPATMEDPLHYGKLDHPGKRVTTLPASSAGEYGKLDRTQMQVKQGKPGDMYDVVTNEPRHVPSKKSKKDDH